MTITDIAAAGPVSPGFTGVASDADSDTGADFQAELQSLEAADSPEPLDPAAEAAVADALYKARLTSVSYMSMLIGQGETTLREWALSNQRAELEEQARTELMQERGYTAEDIAAMSYSDRQVFEAEAKCLTEEKMAQAIKEGWLEKTRRYEESLYSERVAEQIKAEIEGEQDLWTT
ncbi:MAG: hypothetical protein EP335_13195 [Alphaproteobacteria bacterium]|nr:MAG: hypothetical protein EP335_13195 [Alphaproteobacteria bacterium]